MAASDPGAMSNKSLILAYFLGVWRKRWVVLTVAWLLCICAWTIVAALPAQYTSSALIYVDAQALLRARDPNLQVDVPRDVEAVRQILGSRPIIEIVVSQAKLRTVAASENSRRAEVSEAQLREAYSQVSRHLTITAQPNRATWNGSGTIRISYSDKDRTTAHSVVSTLIQVFQQYTAQYSQDDLGKSRRLIENEISNVKTKIEEADAAISEFKKEHSRELLGYEDVLVRLEDSETSLRQLETDLQAAVLRRDQMRTQLSSVSPDPVLVEKLKELLTKYGEKHPEVIATRQAIEESKNGSAYALYNTNNWYGKLAYDLQSTESEIAALKVRIKDLTGRRNKERIRADKAPGAQMELARLEREYDALNKNYMALLDRREGTGSAERTSAESADSAIRVIEPPSRPGGPSSPRRGLFSAAVLVGGIGAGLCLALGWLVMRAPVLTLEQLSMHQSVPVLGSISEVRRGKWVSELSFYLCSVVLAGLGIYLVVHFGNIELSKIITSVTKGIRHAMQGMK